MSAVLMVIFKILILGWEMATSV